jgi:maltooligosyltrehalose trehalohydrolase
LPYEPAAPESNPAKWSSYEQEGHLIGAQNPASTLGACVIDSDRCSFEVWAPKAQRVELHLLSPEERILELQPDERGYYSTTIEKLTAGSTYVVRLDGQKERPDPASRFQPEGVHGPSQVIDHRTFEWTDHNWRTPGLQDFIFYELHVGTFTPEGNFDSVVSQLPALRDLGVTAVELMPVAQFPGNRNWGYDGVYPFAVQNSYGGPEGLKRLINACHHAGLAVVLDVVYNHLGPEGNYLDEFGHYFSESYKTPWGRALNFDGPYSDEVARFFIENALSWFADFHIDALRLDAIHGIFDINARPFLAMLSDSVHELAQKLERRCYLIAESDLNDVKVLQATALCGFGMDAQWSDDFHHALHTLLTKEQGGYYLDFGGIECLGKAYGEGFVYSGQHSRHRARRHGNSSRSISAHRFVVCAQNHDQVGNRMLGDRLSTLVSYERLKLAAGVMILSPFLPLLFMGEEYGELSPFQYFTSHSEPSLVEAVRRGRQAEFAAFGWQGEVPDPQDESTFLRSRLNRDRISDPQHQTLLGFYKALIALRKQTPALAGGDGQEREVTGVEERKVLLVRGRAHRSEVFMAFNFEEEATSLNSIWSGRWQKRLDSADRCWLGPGSAVPEIITGRDSIESAHEQIHDEQGVTVGASALVVFTRTMTDNL